MPSMMLNTVRACSIAAMLPMASAACTDTSDNTASVEAQTNMLSSKPSQARDDGMTNAVAKRDPASGEPDVAQWAGIYTYAFNGGSNAAGTQTVVTYTLELSAAACTLTAQGYQTDETVLCTSKPIADGVDVAFRSFGDGEPTDKYGNAVYSAGDLLFSLQRKDGKIVTRWKGYPLPDDKPHPIGVYFENRS